MRAETGRAPGTGAAERTVAVAMSGGVDSSAAAALLLEAGWQVFGLTMETGFAGEALRAAAEAAGSLGIPHYTVDLTERFRASVVEPFCRDYTAGLTPNPCLRCNRLLKFGELLQAARRLGAGFLATGHYVRVEERPPGVFRLLKGRDTGKDQSYFLYALGQEELAQCLFPLGELHKEEVRAFAAARRLPAASRSESQDICFVSGSDYSATIARVTGAEPVPGPITDARGRRLGTHRGLAFYTVGQRRALKVTNPVPLYVRALDPETNTVVVGEAAELESRWLLAGDATFVSGRTPADGLRLGVKVRYRARQAAAVFTQSPGEPGAGPGFRLEFEVPQRAAAPGQAAVLYDGPEVVGGGIILTSESREKALLALRRRSPGDKDHS